MASGTKDKSTGRDEASFSSQLCKPEVSEPLVLFIWNIGDQSLPWASSGTRQALWLLSMAGDGSELPNSDFWTNLIFLGCG